MKNLLNLYYRARRRLRCGIGRCVFSPSFVATAEAADLAGSENPVDMVVICLYYY